MNRNIIEHLRYFKGEKENPFNWQNENSQNQFWYYERQFYYMYERGNYETLSVSEALKKFLNELFLHLAAKYESCDGGEFYRKEYEKVK